MEPNEMQQVLRGLADREEIRDLARRYAHCIWQRDIEGAIELFAEDGSMEMDDRPPIVGRAALVASYRALLDGEFEPFVHNHLIEVDGDRARGVCYLDLRATVGGKAMLGAGHYEDEYVRRDGRWKFLRRRLKMAHFAPVTEGWHQTEEAGAD